MPSCLLRKKIIFIQSRLENCSVGKAFVLKAQGHKLNPQSPHRIQIWQCMFVIPTLGKWTGVSLGSPGKLPNLTQLVSFRPVRDLIPKKVFIFLRVTPRVVFWPTHIQTLLKTTIIRSWGNGSVSKAFVWKHESSTHVHRVAGRATVTAALQIQGSVRAGPVRDPASLQWRAIQRNCISLEPPLVCTSKDTCAHTCE